MVFDAVVRQLWRLNLEGFAAIAVFRQIKWKDPINKDDVDDDDDNDDDDDVEAADNGTLIPFIRNNRKSKRGKASFLSSTFSAATDAIDKILIRSWLRRQRISKKGKGGMEDLIVKH